MNLRTFSLSLSLSLLFAKLTALRDIHEAPHHVAVFQNSPACDASRLRRLKRSRTALLFWGVVLRRGPLVLGLRNAQRYQTNDAR
jgi:hypothetical protein